MSAPYLLYVTHLFEMFLTAALLSPFKLYGLKRLKTVFPIHDKGLPFGTQAVRLKALLGLNVREPCGRPK